jgi:gamma-glutamylcyclotransferase (GGCT)/AIG2-like uncharacterized protein YtfP
VNARSEAVAAVSRAVSGKARLRTQLAPRPVTPEPTTATFILPSARRRGVTSSSEGPSDQSASNAAARAVKGRFLLWHPHAAPSAACSSGCRVSLTAYKVIAKVVGHETRDLHFSLARLQDHARHHIRGADYPALVSAVVHHTLAGNNATKNPSVQGVLVSGLSEQDMKLLDAWEGDEYERVEVSVQLEDGSSRLAQAYLWRDSAERLAPEMWSFEAFMKEKAHHCEFCANLSRLC